MMSNILDKIDSPEDLKGLSEKELYQLAGEIRELILDVVSRNGGHLASSLGTVELTVALHQVFSAPKDKFVWDVGHQAYAHKILTGRRARFNTLRLTNGLNGFTKPCESEYDSFISGHAGNSISAALGMAIARDIKHEQYKVVAILGDGSLSCGIPFEAMNHTGMLQPDLMIVLNDNNMSISHNIGALSKYLNHIVQSRTYNISKTNTKKFLRKYVPGSGKIIAFIRRLQESIKGLLVPSMIFEDLGIRYIGPIDGHNIHQLLKTFRAVRQLHEPVIVHVVTKKGKGYWKAESNPTHYHGTPKFDPEIGLSHTAHAKTYTSIFGEKIVQLARENPKIVAITAAMTEGTGLTTFAKELPGQFFDVGIAEEHAVICAGGMAKEGLRPVVAIYSSFLQRAYDLIMHDVLLLELPVVFAIDRAGFVGADGPTHHGLFDIAYLRTLPRIVIMAPRDGSEFSVMLDWALKSNKAPVAIRYPRSQVNPKLTEHEVEQIVLGEPEIVKQGDNDIVIVSYGHIYSEVIKAMQTLIDDHHLSVTLINARFAKPINHEFYRDLTLKCKRLLVTIEEGTILGGFGSAINEVIVGLHKTCTVLNLGVPDKFIEHGTIKWQREQVGLDAAGIIKSILSELDH